MGMIWYKLSIIPIWLYSWTRPLKGHPCRPPKCISHCNLSMLHPALRDHDFSVPWAVSKDRVDCCSLFFFYQRCCVWGTYLAMLTRWSGLPLRGLMASSSLSMLVAMTLAPVSRTAARKPSCSSSADSTIRRQSRLARCKCSSPERLIGKGIFRVNTVYRCQFWTGH